MASSSGTYSLNSQDLIVAAGNVDRASERILAQIRAGTIPFPFQRLFQLPAATLFENLQRFVPTVAIAADLRLNSYSPNFATYLPPLFRGQPVKLITEKSVYDQIDVLSDLFQEEHRLRAKRYDQELSVAQCWDADACLTKIIIKALEKPTFTPRSFRDAIYETIMEATAFSPTWGRGLLQIVYGQVDSKTVTLADPKIFEGKKWLDISAGWGDRLLVAMSLQMDYLGYDPNLELKPGHDAMISQFGDPNRHRIIYEPFETAVIPGGLYDVVLTSPPYFSIEEYAPGQMGQSIVSFPEKTQWMIWFMYRALANAWNHLAEGGYLILHLGDSINRNDPSQSVTIAEATNIIIENYLIGASWEGVIGLAGKGGYARPVWVWRKMAAAKVWQPQTQIAGTRNLPFQERTLFRTYPEYQAELIRYYATQYSPTYAARLHNLHQVSSESDDMVSILMVETSASTEAVRASTSYSIARANGRIVRDPTRWGLLPVASEGLNIFDDLMIDSVLRDLGPDQFKIWMNAMILMVYPRRVIGVRLMTAGLP